VNWLGHVPIHLSWFPSLAWATIIWLGLFLASSLYAAQLAARAWHGYLACRTLPDAKAERTFALGQAAARTFGTVMVACGIVVGLVSAAQPRRAEVPLTPGTLAFILIFLVFALALLGQTVVLEWSQRSAFEALRQRAEREVSPDVQGTVSRSDTSTGE